MATLFEDDFAPTEQDVLATPDTGDYKITSIPWEDFGTGPLKVTITMEARKVSGEPLLNAFVAPSNYYADAPDYDDLIGANVTTGSFVEYTFGYLGTEYMEFAGPGAARTLYISSGHVYPPGSGGDFKVKNIHVKVEGDPSFGVEIVSPAEGVTLGPDDALVFRVFNDGLPDTLTADVTLPDGTVERAWEYDQAVGVYAGSSSLEIDGNRRTYTIRRPIGWPFGGVSLAVNVYDADAGESVTTTQTAFTGLGPFSSGAAATPAVNVWEEEVDFDTVEDGIFHARVSMQPVSATDDDAIIQLKLGGTAGGTDGELLFEMNVDDAFSFVGGVWDAQQNLSGGAYEVENPGGSQLVKLILIAGPSAGVTIEDVEVRIGERQGVLWTQTYNEELGPHTSILGEYDPLKSIKDDRPDVGALGPIPINGMPAGATQLKLTMTGQIKATVISGTKQAWLNISGLDSPLTYEGAATSSGISAQNGRAYMAAPSGDWEPIVLVAEVTTGTPGDPDIRFTNSNDGIQIVFGAAYRKTPNTSQTVYIRNYTLTIETVDVDGGEPGPAEADASRSWIVAGRTDAKARVIIQYHDDYRLCAEVDLYATLIDQIIAVLWQIAELDDPEIATGVNLTVTGELVGQGRDLGGGNVADDPKMRLMIAARKARNTAKPSGADYLAMLVAFFGARVVLVDHGGMSAGYTVMRAPTAEEVALLGSDIVPRQMGVRVTHSFANPVGFFGFSDQPNAKGFAELGDEANYPGGIWNELF